MPKMSKLLSRIQKNTDWVVVVFLVVFSGFFIFWGLGRTTLVDWDESIYAGVAKEMVVRGDWLTLYWNGQKFFEKPPLYFWLTALNFLIFGFSEFAARFWSAILGIIGVVVVYFFGREVFDRLAGFTAALILASTPHWVLQSRNGTLDIMAASFVILTLYFFWKARKEPRFWKISGIFLGLTFMTKNVVAVIPLLIMGIFAALEISFERNLKKYPSKSLLLFILCSLLVILPWHLIMLLIHGQDFIGEYFFYHILARTRGIEGHSKPWFWYFIVLQHWGRFWYLLFLGAIYLLAGFIVRDGIKKHKPGFFLFLWFFLAFLIFSISKSKIEWYIIPLYPAMALLIGGFCSSFLKYFGPVKRLWLVGLFVIFCLFSLYESLHLWRLEDYNRDIARAAEAAKAVSRPEDKVYVANLAPGPPIFYSGRRVITIDWWGLKKKVGDGGRVFILSPWELWWNLSSEGLSSDLEIFERSGGVVLYGRQ